MVNCLRIGDRVEVDPYWPKAYEGTLYEGKVLAFEKVFGEQLVLVAPLDESPMRDEELYSFRAVRPLCDRTDIP